MSDGMGGELIYSDYDLAYEEANRLDDDADFYERYSHEVGANDPIEPEVIDVDEGYISYLNRDKFTPSRMRTEDGKILKEGDDYYSYVKSGKERVYYADKEVAEKNFNQDKEAGLIPSNPMNNPYNKNTVSAIDIRSGNIHYKDGDRSYSIPDEINDKFIERPIRTENIDKVLDSSLNEGSYNVNYKNEDGETLNAEIVKVEDGKYFIRGEVQKSDGISTIFIPTGNITFNANDVRGEIDKTDNISPSDIFNAINSIIKKKSK